MQSLIGARNEVSENGTQEEDLMVDQVDLIMEDNFKEVECLGSTWMVTWAAPSGVKYLDKCTNELLWEKFNINLQ